MGSVSNGANIRSGAIFIYVETSVSLFLGYVFWILMSKFGTAEIIGTSSAIISLAGILAVVANLGIPTGVQRFLGKSFAHSSSEDTRYYFISSLLLISTSCFIVTLSVVILSEYILTFFQIEGEFLLISVLLMISIVYATFFRGIVISSLQTKILTVSITLSAIIKIILGVIFLANDYGTFGLVLSFTINQCIVSVILAIAMIRLVHSSGNKMSLNDNFRIRIFNIARSIKEVFVSSLSNWIPLVITTIGSQVGTIFVYGINGATDAGLFFMALTIVAGITSIMYSLFTISLPAMSAMKDERRTFTTYTIKLSILIALPLSIAIMFYSEKILGLLGGVYTDAALILEILILSLLPTAIHYGITSVVYSYGKYKEVLFLGLAISIPRVLLYYTLIPLWGGLGGAIGFTLGAIIGFVVSIVMARENNIKLEWKNYIFIFSVPLGVGYVIQLFNSNFLVGIPLIVMVSYLVLYLLKILSMDEINLVVRILPTNVSAFINRLTSKKRL
ncbi:hypothetical protein BH23THE1_BH23THE1_26270 [soil metagenome]